jgi:hypothetical protein
MPGFAPQDANGDVMTTTFDTAKVPHAAYMLADHLDAALAAGEDILSAGGRTRLDDAVLPGGQVALRSGVELIRSLELALITRVIKAREWSKALDKADSRFKIIGQLFQSGTVQLVDAIAEFADATEADFETGDGITAYFRSRGVIDAESPALVAGDAALVGEAFLVTGRIQLGALLDLIAAYLDALETQFILFTAAPVTPAVMPQQREAVASGP